MFTRSRTVCDFVERVVHDFLCVGAQHVGAVRSLQVNQLVLVISDDVICRLTERARGVRRSWLDCTARRAVCTRRSGMPAMSCAVLTSVPHALLFTYGAAIAVTDR